MKNPPEIPIEQVTVHMIGNAHIDPVWLWRWLEGRDEVLSTCQSALDRIEETPDFIFTRSSAATYKWIEESDPEMFSQIQRRVREGRWAIVGGWWVQPDANIPCGESFVRQALYGKRYFKEKFGVEVTIGYNVDTFGHNGNLPQILARSGYVGYVFFRPGPHEKKLPSGLFWWEAADGSRVLACRPPHHYGTWGDINMEERIIQAAEQAPGIRDVMCFYGVGNHGGGPTKQHIQAIMQFAERPSGPHVEFSSPARFFRAALPQAMECPVVRDELQHHSRGCYTALSEIKYHNRKSEHTLMTAEKWAALAQVFFGVRYPREDLRQAWENVLFNQFHDILAGTSIPEAYDDARVMYGEAYRLAEQAQKAALDRIMAHIDTTGEGEALVVFNPLAWNRKEAVEAVIHSRDLFRLVTEGEMRELPSRIRIRDEEGREVPSQVTKIEHAGRYDDIHVVFVASIPPLGYRTFRVDIPEGVESFSPPSEEPVEQVETPLYKLTFDPQTGWLTSLYDKRCEAELLAGPANVPIVLDDPSDTWSHGVDSFRNEVGRFKAVAPPAIVERGPVRTVVRVISAYGKSKIVQDIALYQDLARIDVEMSIDWQERLKMLKLSFPLRLEDSTATAEIPYGSIVRGQTGGEEPMQQWVDVTGRIGSTTCGLSLLNDCKYGYDVLKSEVRLSILRSPIYAFHHPRDIKAGVVYPYTDQGRQVVHYSLWPHTGPWETAGTVQQAYQINVPVIARSEPAHEGTLSSRQSFIQVEPSNVILNVVKMAEDSNDLILRLYEIAGKDTVTRVSIPGLSRSWNILVRGHAIHTLKICIDGDYIALSEVDLIERVLA